LPTFKGKGKETPNNLKDYIINRGKDVATSNIDNTISNRFITPDTALVNIYDRIRDIVYSGLTTEEKNKLILGLYDQAISQIII
jgi:hypothetical protein